MPLKKSTKKKTINKKDRHTKRQYIESSLKNKQNKKRKRKLKKQKQKIIKENEKQATMSFLVEVIPPLIWIILR